MEFLTFAVILLWLVVVALIAVVFVLARQIGVLHERVSPVGAMISHAGPEIGAEAPRLALRNLTGPDRTLGAGPRSQLLFFLSPTCPICKALTPAVRDIAAAEGDWLDVMLASDGREETHRAFLAAERLSGFPYVLSSELGQTFRIAKLPYAVLIDGGGVVRAKGLVNTREQLESLFHAVETGIPSIQSLAAAAPRIA